MAETEAAGLDPAPARAESFDAFFLREYPSLVALAAATSGNRSIAEDLAQEALSRAHRRWSTVSTYDRPGAWVRRVTINLSISARRRFAAETRARLRMRPEPDLPGPSLPNAELWDAVAALPGKQRAAIALRYLEDRSVKEIAELLDCAEGTAKTHLHRGRQALHARLEPQHD